MTIKEIIEKKGLEHLPINFKGLKTGQEVDYEGQTVSVISIETWAVHDSNEGPALPSDEISYYLYSMDLTDGSNLIYNQRGRIYEKDDLKSVKILERMP